MGSAVAAPPGALRWRSSSAKALAVSTRAAERAARWRTATGPRSVRLQVLPARHRPRRLAVVLPLPQRLPLVVVLLAARDGDLDLRAPVLEVQGQRHDRQAALAGRLGEPQDLVPVQEQLALATGLVVRPRPLGVLRDVHALEPRLPVVDAGEPVDKGRPPGAQGLDLGAGEHQAGLDDVLEVVVVPRLAVARDELAPGLLDHVHPSSRRFAGGRCYPPAGPPDAARRLRSSDAG